MRADGIPQRMTANSMRLMRTPLPQLNRSQRHRRQHGAYEPESRDHLRLGPALAQEVQVERGDEEDSACAERSWCGPGDERASSSHLVGLECLKRLSNSHPPSSAVMAAGSGMGVRRKAC